MAFVLFHKMAETAQVATVWEDKIGDVKVTRLQEPVLVRLPRGTRKPTQNLTGLYLRYYNKDQRQHFYGLLLYAPNELQQLPGTMHLRALARFHEEYGFKVSFCLGFALGENLVVKRNSCSNVRTGDGRALDDDRYNQLINIMLNLKWDVTSDADMDSLSSSLSKLNLKRK